MSSRFVAGVCAIALAGASAVTLASRADAQHPTVVRLSVPVPVDSARGSGSFASTLGGTRWRVAFVCAGAAGRGRVSLVIVSEPDEG
jgi:hypothetical protein